MINNQENNPPKPSLLWKITKYLLSTLFPFFKMLWLNKQLKLAERTLIHELYDKEKNYARPYDWFPRQRKKNLILSFVSVLPILFSLLISYKTLSTNPDLMKVYNSTKVKFYKKPKIVYDLKQVDKTINEDINLSVNMILISLGFSFISGMIIVYLHPVITETKKLRNQLIQAGLIKKEEQSVVLATPVGFLIDITGNIPAEIAKNDRIWIPLNVLVNKDWAENPEKRSLVFFKKTYELKKGADYGFTQIPKEKP